MIGAIQALMGNIKGRPNGMHAMLVVLDLSPQVFYELRWPRTPPYLQMTVASFMTNRRSVFGSSTDRSK